MGRRRSIDEQQVIASAANLFIEIGFEATSVDDLVETVALHRGSLYKAFGSKRGIFVAALRRLVDLDLPAAPADPDALVAGRTLDLLLVAALELAPRDDEVRQLVETACRLLAERLPGSAPHGSAGLLGRRLLERAIHPEPVVPNPRGGPSDGTREHGRRLDDGRDAGAAQGRALKSRIVVPLAHVRGATADPGMMREPKGLRAPGLHIPGGAVIGTFHRDGEATFWDVSKRARAVVIELVDGAYNRIIVDVADPRGIVTAINRATG